MTSTDNDGLLSQRVWYKTNQVYDWETGAASEYTSFPVDMFYPANTYLGTATSRAAVGRILLVKEHTLVDSVILHEFGHEVFYRRILGETDYTNLYRESTQLLTAGSFPLCVGSIGHTLREESSGCAAMNEGWANFFQVVAVGNLAHVKSDPWRFDIEDFWTPSDRGQFVEGWVTAYFWDLYDADRLIGSTTIPDDDPVTPSGAARARDDGVAELITGGNQRITVGFEKLYLEEIEPSLSSPEVALHCELLELNTLNFATSNSVDPTCPR